VVESTFSTNLVKSTGSADASLIPSVNCNMQKLDLADSNLLGLPMLPEQWRNWLQTSNKRIQSLLPTATLRWTRTVIDDIFERHATRCMTMSVDARRA
jgi:hypothetical protein